MAMDPFISATLTSSVGKLTGEKAAPSVSSVGAGEESPFHRVLQELGGAQDLGIDANDLAPGGHPFSTISAEGIAPLREYTEIAPSGKQGMSLVVDLLQDVNAGQMKMDHFLNEILYGQRKFSQQELLAIQARVYHFAQLTEMTVKVAQEGVSSAKTLLNTQVQ